MTEIHTGPDVCQMTFDEMEFEDMFDVVRAWEIEDVRSDHPDTVWINLLAGKR